MKLPKITRKRIYAAAPGTCEIQWPSPSPPRIGHKYTIQTEANAAGAHRLVVVGRKEIANGWKATVQLEGDRVHLLGKSGGYVESHQGAITANERTEEGVFDPEPEGVPPAEIAGYRSSREARTRHQQERAEDAGELLGAMAELRAAIDTMPEGRKRRMSRTLWTLRSRLDSAERELRRRAAA